jgi:hypothetical protein
MALKLFLAIVFGFGEVGDDSTLSDFPVIFGA